MSEQTLDLLIERLRTEAIEKAEKESAEILSEARAQAASIVAEAKEEKQSILADAEKEAGEIVANGKSALQVAARDLSLSLRNDLMQLLRAALEKEVEANFSSDLMKEVVSRVVGQIGEEQLEISLPEAQADELAAYIRQRLQHSEGSISLLERPSASAGITISKKEEGWSYDITPAQITEALLPLLNAKWAQMLTEQTSS